MASKRLFKSGSEGTWAAGAKGLIEGIMAGRQLEEMATDRALKKQVEDLQLAEFNRKGVESGLDRALKERELGVQEDYKKAYINYLNRLASVKEETVPTTIKETPEQADARKRLLKLKEVQTTRELTPSELEYAQFLGATARKEISIKQGPPTRIGLKTPYLGYTKPGKKQFNIALPGMGGATPDILPPQALKVLQTSNGEEFTFENGQTWKIENGKPVRVR